MLMLAAAVLLGVVAVAMARLFIIPGESETMLASPAAAVVPTQAAVIATKPLVFGEKVTREHLRQVEFPVIGLPEGAFKSLDEAVGPGNRVALRAIEANEVITAKAISGTSARLSASGALRPGMRAVAIPTSEAQAVGGFVVSGDRVDVFLTTGDGEAKATTLLVANVRVLATGQDPNPSREQPSVTGSVTVEVTPEDARRVVLAHTQGTLTVALRSLEDGALLAAAPPAGEAAAAVAPALRRAWRPRGVARAAESARQPSHQVAVVRGTATTSYSFEGRP